MDDLPPHHRDRILASLSRSEAGFATDISGRAEMSDSELIRIRKEKAVKFLKEKYMWFAYVILAGIVWMAVKIRTRNLPGLRDITTGTWTLGPDLDPFFFLRWSKYIVENGTLFVLDKMRYTPLGIETSGEYLLHPYMMAWFHNYIGPLFSTESVTHSAVLYPVFMFALTVVAFFLMVRKIFVNSMGERKANIIALIASFFLSVIPALLPRTIAGIPEKESAAFFFFFMAFYLFLAAWNSDRKYGKYILAALSGLFTAGMAHIWGGYIFIFAALAPTVFIAFLLGKVDRIKFYTYASWVLFSFIGMVFVFEKHSAFGFVKAVTSSGLAVGVLFIMIIHAIVFESRFKDKFSKYFERGFVSNIPKKIISVVLSVIVLALLATIVFGPSFIPSVLGNISDTLIKPATSRLIQTVAENRQPFFTEWVRNFGPHFRGIPVTFWLFFVGSIYLFYKMIGGFRKEERRNLTFAYLVLISSLVFSRYSSSSSLNGENFISLLFYAGGFIFFLALFGFYYYRHDKAGEMETLKNIDFGFLFLFLLFFLNLIAARSAIRTVMLLVPSASAIISYFVVSSFDDAREMKDKTLRYLTWALVVLIIISTLFAAQGFYNGVNAQARGYAPSIYTQQWQKAMEWVRDSTAEDSVFGHWWDYGYWVQSIGERATVLDGGNMISYWNHLMGRYALTGTDSREAAEFLYAHDTTHFLIDPTDIGKYSAFSTIGSDISYDRQSYIQTFQRNNDQIEERKNSTVFIYQGGVGLDEDIVYEENGTRIFLPAGAAGLGAILIEKNAANEMVTQPIGVFVYQGQRYEIPFRYAYDDEFIDFETGIEAGVFLYPRAVQSGGGVQLEDDGALMYLSKRTVNSQLARLYLYKLDDPYFKLVHSEDDFFVAQVKEQNPGFDSDFINYQGIRGPIRIWEIDYPEDMVIREEFLETVYPENLQYDS